MTGRGKMSNEVDTYDELVENVEEGIGELYREHGEIDHEDLYDIIDRVMPIYNHTLLTIARSNLNLVSREVETPKNSVSVSNLLQTAIYDDLFTIGTNLIDELDDNKSPSPSMED